MTDLNEVQKRLESLKREYRGVRSMIEMMEKGTPRAELEKMRKDKLRPIEDQIKRLEMVIKGGLSAR